MSLQVLNRGTFLDDPSADSGYVGAGKVIANFSELYTLLGNGTTLSITGDITMSAGVVAIGASKVTNTMLAGSIATSKLLTSFSTGLNLSGDTLTVNLSTGVSGGQTLIFGTGAGDGGTISTTSNGTKGKIILGSASAYDEVNDRIGIGITSPLYKMHIIWTGGSAVTSTSTNPNVFVAASTNGTLSGYEVKNTSTGTSSVVRATVALCGSTNFEILLSGQNSSTFSLGVGYSVLRHVVGAGGLALEIQAASPLKIYTNSVYRGGVSSAGVWNPILTDSTTTTVSNLLLLTHNGGSVGNGFGTTIQFQLESSTTDSQAAADIETKWINATHATRASSIALYAYYTSTAQEGIRITGGSSTVLIGVYGATPVARPAAYTQTYSTATRTHSNPTATSVVTTAATQTTPWGFSTQAQADALSTTLNAAIVDIANIKQVVNQMLDDFQLRGDLQ